MSNNKPAYNYDAAGPFNIRNLASLSYAMGFTPWCYIARDTDSAVMLAPGFFNAAWDMFNEGDVINCVAADGTAVRSVHLDGHDVTLRPLL